MAAKTAVALARRPALVLACAALASCASAPERSAPERPAPEQSAPAPAGVTAPAAPQPPRPGGGPAVPGTARMQHVNRPTAWWMALGTKPDSFYRTEEGRRIAENILSWQDKAAGGWPLMNTTRERNTGDPALAGPWGAKAALVKATVNEMRFLARGYRATKDARYKTAVLDGLDFILQAQYPSGGWPHSYPVRADYTRHATFNDDLMPDLMTLLREAATSRDFELLDAPLRARAQAAFDRGVDFILKSQIRVDGQLTAWGQQHDAQSHEPRPARAFEPAALAGSESASVLLVLMGIPRPSAAVQAAVEAGVAWMRGAALRGLRVQHTAGPAADRVVVPDASAPPIWARFYEIGTGRPIFAGRDGVVRYSLAEIEQERRAGYAWYGQAGAGVLARHEAWRNERRWDTQPRTNTDEARVGPYTLPELLRMVDGSPVQTVADWEARRRPEIMRLLAAYQHGTTPAQPIRTRVQAFERDGTGLGGAAKRTQLRISFPDHPGGPTIRVLLYTPANATAPVPTLLHLSFTPNVLNLDEPGLDEGMAWSAALKAPVPDRDAVKVGFFDARSFVARGYGVALVYYGDIYPDFDHGNALGVTALFGPKPARRAPDEWGAIGAWSWGLSRVLDQLTKEPTVDASKVALSGASRLGKTVLWAAAQDRRFALVMPLISGEGGAAISRRFYGETIADLTHPARYPYWFAPRYQDQAFTVDELPVDGHMLLAMVAPRPVLQIVGTKDTWSDPRGEYVAAKAAEAVWRLLGRSHLPLGEYPRADQPVLGDMGFFLHAGEHAVLPIDFKVMADFLDLHFGPATR